MKFSDIKISVIIPVYNAEAYLERCINSISAQRMNEIEIIAVNDGSADGSLAKLRHLQQAEPRLRIIDKPHNQGTMLARRDGIMTANGCYLTFVDADDYLPTNALKALFTRAIETGADMVIGDYMDITTNGSKIYISQNDPGTTAQQFMSSLLKEYNIPSVWGKLFKKSLYNQQLFVELGSTTLSEDRQWLLQYMALASTVSHVKKACYCYVHHSESITHRGLSDKAIKQFETTNSWCDQFIMDRFPALSREVKLGQTMDAMTLIVRMIMKGSQNFKDLKKASPIYASYLSLARLTDKFGLITGIHKYLWCHSSIYRTQWQHLKRQ